MVDNKLFSLTFPVDYLGSVENMPSKVIVYWNVLLLNFCFIFVLKLNQIFNKMQWKMIFSDSHRWTNHLQRIPESGFIRMFEIVSNTDG